MSVLPPAFETSWCSTYLVFTILLCNAAIVLAPLPNMSNSSMQVGSWQQSTIPQLHSVLTSSTSFTSCKIRTDVIHTTSIMQSSSAPMLLVLSLWRVSSLKAVKVSSLARLYRRTSRLICSWVKVTQQQIPQGQWGSLLFWLITCWVHEEDYAIPQMSEGSVWLPFYGYLNQTGVLA